MLLGDLSADLRRLLADGFPMSAAFSAMIILYRRSSTGTMCAPLPGVNQRPVQADPQLCPNEASGVPWFYELPRGERA
jgi:hypothetical protein